MDWIIEYLEDLVTFIQKETQIANVALFNSGEAGLSCTVVPEAITPNGPTKTGRDINISVILSSPIEDWKILIMALAKLDKMFTTFESVNNDLKFRFTASMGEWSRVPDNSTLIYSLSLTLRGVRFGA
jgi:hypothetical protein